MTHTPAQLAQAREKLTSARILCARKVSPYLAHALYALVFAPAPIATMGITRKYACGFGVGFVLAESVPTLALILLHEVAHPLRQHFSRWERAGRPEFGAWNRAADREINDDLDALIRAYNSQIADTARHLAWPGRCKPCLPIDIGMQAGLLAEEYLAGEPGSPDSDPGSDPGSPGSDPGSPDSDPGSDPGAPGSDPGSPGSDPGSPGSDPGTGSNPATMGPDGCGSAAGGEPAEWEKAIDSKIDRTDRDCDAIEQKVAQDTKRWVASKGCGSGVGGWDRWADQVLGPVKTKWQDRLRRIVSNRVARMGRKKAVYTRPSRLQSCVGYSAGSPILSGRRAHIPKILVAIDTSGSVGEKEIGVAMSHISAILKATRGADITVCACDTQIQGWVSGVRVWRQAIRAIKGGGGTEFRPVFERAASEHIDLLVYITDGQCYNARTIPEPDRMHTVWVLAGSYHVGKSPTGWGDCVISD